MKDWTECGELFEDAVKTGTSVVEISFLYDYELQWAADHGTSWYRSKEKKGGENPFNSFLMNKKWTLEEEFNIHMLRFQQVRVSFNKSNEF